MNTTTKANYHTVEEEWLASYSGGGLSVAKRFVVDCQAAINPRLSVQLEEMDTVGGALLETAKGESLGSDFMSRVFGSLDMETPTSQASVADGDIAPSSSESWLPLPLRNYLLEQGIPLEWKKMGFGMARMPLMQDGKETLYLLKAPPGMKMPHHSHHGEEWALILQGGYHVGETGFVRGDLHREDETCTHQPIIDDHGEACITLVASEGGLKFSNPLLSLLKPILGI